MQKILSLVSCTFVLLLSVNAANAARNVTLPHHEDFSATNSISDLAWAVNGATVTRVQQSWRGASDYCVRITPPTSVDSTNNGRYGAIGSFLFPATNTINIAFALNVGTTYSSSAANAGGSLINKFVDIFGPGDRSGLLGINNRGSCNSHEFGLLNMNDGYYWYNNTPAPTFTGNCAGVYFSNGTSGSGDIAGDWIWLNYAVNHNTGDVVLRIWDREGNYSGNHIQIARATDRSTNEIRTIGGYYNEYHPTADSNSRLLIDDLVISTDVNPILPPSFFITGGTIPADLAPPADFRATSITR